MAANIIGQNQIPPTNNLLTLRMHYIELSGETNKIYHPQLLDGYSIELFPDEYYPDYDSFLTIGSFVGPLSSAPGVVTINNAANYIFNSDEVKDIGWYLTGVDITQIVNRYYPISQMHIKSDAQGTWKFQYGSDIIEGTIQNGNMIVTNPNYMIFYDNLSRFYDDIDIKVTGIDTPYKLIYNSFGYERPFNAGDFNEDLIVNYYDLVKVIDFWGLAPYYYTADDLDSLLGQWLITYDRLAPEPEPEPEPETEDPEPEPEPEPEPQPEPQPEPEPNLNRNLNWNHNRNRTRTGTRTGT